MLRLVLQVRLRQLISMVPGNWRPEFRPPTVVMAAVFILLAVATRARPAQAAGVLLVSGRPGPAFRRSRRELMDKMLAVTPAIRTMARENRAFPGRAVR